MLMINPSKLNSSSLLRHGAMKDTLFSDYKIQSNANNEINLEVPTASFVRALKNGQNSTKSVLRLARKNEMAVMSFEFETTTVCVIELLICLSPAVLDVEYTFESTSRFQTKNARKLKATHDIRIEVLRSTVVEQLREPECPDPNVLIPIPFSYRSMPLLSFKLTISARSSSRYTSFFPSWRICGR